MSLKEELKKEANRETKKLKEMSFQDKIWYIWEYYKFHIAAVFGLIFLIGVVVTGIYNSTKETMLYCAVINNYSGDLNTEAFTVDFHDAMGYGKKQNVFVENLYATYGETISELGMATLAKLSALVASKELDIMIADQQNIDHFEEMDGFCNLEEVLPSRLWDTVKDRIYYGTSSDGTKIPVAVDISNTSFAQNSNITMKPAYLALLANTTRTEQILAFLDYIFSQSF